MLGASNPMHGMNVLSRQPGKKDSGKSNMVGGWVKWEN